MKKTCEILFPEEKLHKKGLGVKFGPSRGKDSFNKKMFEVHIM